MKKKVKVKAKVKKEAFGILTGRDVLIVDNVNRDKIHASYPFDGEVIYRLMRWEDKNEIKIVNLDRKEQELILEG